MAKHFQTLVGCTTCAVTKEGEHLRILVNSSGYLGSVCFNGLGSHSRLSWDCCLTFFSILQSLP